MNEKMNKDFQSIEDVVTMSHATNESRDFSFTGEVFDTITHKDGRVEKRERSFNIVVDSISKLISALIKHQTDYVEGRLFWAVGEGLPGWDTAPYSPVATTTKLHAECFRKQITSRSFIDQEGAKTEEVTNRLQLDIILETNEANGKSLREFGIFGGNVTSVANSGVMINHKAHSRIDKEEGMKVERSVRFTF